MNGNWKQAIPNHGWLDCPYGGFLSLLNENIEIICPQNQDVICTSEDNNPYELTTSSTYAQTTSSSLPSSDYSPGNYLTTAQSDTHSISSASYRKHSVRFTVHVLWILVKWLV